MYAAAHVNDVAASDLSESAKLLASAADSATASNRTAALADANSAVDLLAKVVESDDTTLDATAMTAATAALSSASAAIDLLGVHSDNAAAQALLRGAYAAGSGSGAAKDAAAMHRYSADELAKQYM